MAKQMQDDKDKFIAKHKIKKGQSDALESAAAERSIGEKHTVVSIPRKRSDNGDDSDGELAALEKKVRSHKGDKAFSNKRQKTK